MSTGVRPPYYPSNPALYPNRQPAYTYAAQNRPSISQYPANYGNFRQNTWVPPRGNQTYQPNLLWFIKQQLGARVINTSRRPITLQQLQGKRDGDPVEALPRINLHQTGVTSVDSALQRTGDLVSYAPQAVRNVISGSIKGAFYIGGGSAVLTAGCFGIGKLLGRLGGISGWYLVAGTLGMGLIGSIAGGTMGFAKAVFNSLRDLKDIVLGNR